ncbi:MAG: WD40 repeat domain-containing protein, partial [Myxococcales bacterium]
VEHLVFAPDGRTFFAVDEISEPDAEEVRAVCSTRDVASGEVRWQFGPGPTAYLGRYSWDGALLVVGFEAPQLSVRDARTGQELRTVDTGAPEPLNLELTPDGEGLLAVLEEEVRMWRLADGAPLWRTPLDVIEVAFSPDGARVVCASWEGELLTLDVKTGRTEARSGGAPKGLAKCVFSGPDRLLLASGWMDDDRRLVEVDAATGTPLRRFRGHRAITRDLVLSPDGTRFWSVDGEGLLCEWAL